MTGPYGNKRTIRPRPLNFEERLPVVWLEKRPDGASSSYAVDKALEQFLRQQEEATLQEYTEQQQSAAVQGANTIFVPMVRQVDNYQEDIERIRSHQDASTSAGATSKSAKPSNAYIIYQDVLRDHAGEGSMGHAEYDMDEEDDSWLDGHNSKVAKGKSRLSADTFEAAMSVMDMAHFEALKGRSAEWQSEVKAGRVPQLPPLDEVLSAEDARAALEQQEPAHAHVTELYQHWTARRMQMPGNGPLVQRLWFEMPWKAICYESQEAGEEGQQGDMPFSVAETKNSSRGGWCRLRLSNEDAYDILFNVRQEMEALRTMADQMRKRERLKKQLLQVWKQARSLEMGIHSFSPSGLEAGAPSPRGPGSRLLKQRAKAAQAAMLAAPPPPAQLSEAFKRRLARGNEREAAALSQLQAGLLHLKDAPKRRGLRELAGLAGPWPRAVDTHPSAAPNALTSQAAHGSSSQGHGGHGQQLQPQVLLPLPASALPRQRSDAEAAKQTEHSLQLQAGRPRALLEKQQRVRCARHNVVDILSSSEDEEAEADERLDVYGKDPRPHARRQVPAARPRARQAAMPQQQELAVPDAARSMRAPASLGPSAHAAAQPAQRAQERGLVGFLGASLGLLRHVLGAYPNGHPPAQSTASSSEDEESLDVLEAAAAVGARSSGLRSQGGVPLRAAGKRTTGPNGGSGQQLLAGSRPGPGPTAMDLPRSAMGPSVKRHKAPPHAASKGADTAVQDGIQVGGHQGPASSSKVGRNSGPAPLHKVTKGALQGMSGGTQVAGQDDPTGSASLQQQQSQQKHKTSLSAKGRVSYELQQLVDQQKRLPREAGMSQGHGVPMRRFDFRRPHLGGMRAGRYVRPEEGAVLANGMLSASASNAVTGPSPSAAARQPKGAFAAQQHKQGKPQPTGKAKAPRASAGSRVLHSVARGRVHKPSSSRAVASASAKAHGLKAAKKLVRAARVHARGKAAESNAQPGQGTQKQAAAAGVSGRLAFGAIAPRLSEGERGTSPGKKYAHSGSSSCVSQGHSPEEPSDSKLDPGKAGMANKQLRKPRKALNAVLKGTGRPGKPASAVGKAIAARGGSNVAGSGLKQAGKSGKQLSGGHGAKAVASGRVQKHTIAR